VTAAGRFSVCVTVDAAGHLVGRFLRQAAGQGGSVAQAGLPLKNSLNILIGGRLLKLCTVHTVSEGVNYSDLGLKTRQATDPENLARPALDWVVRAAGVVGIAGDGVLVHVG